MGLRRHEDDTTRPVVEPEEPTTPVPQLPAAALADPLPVTPLVNPREIETRTEPGPQNAPAEPRLEQLQPQIIGRIYTGVILAVLVILALLLLLGGYSFDVNSFRFFGILFTTDGIVGAFFKLRYGIIVAPPRKKS